MEKFGIGKICIIVLAVCIITATAAFDPFFRESLLLQDLIYQSEEVLEPIVTVIGIDDKALQTLGPMPWPRSVYAELIETLNKDPKNAPAAIGINEVLLGESRIPGDDDALYRALRFGNTVLANCGSFGTVINETEENEFQVDTLQALSWSLPPQRFLERARTGHTNIMMDADGVVRHVMAYAVMPDGEKMPSFARALYELYCERESGMSREEAAASNMPACSEDGFYYLAYSGKPGAYSDFVSAADLLDGSVRGSDFQGRIVLIGSYAPSLRSQYTAAIDHADPMYGIEIQANQIDSYFRGCFPVEASYSLHLVLLFLSTLFLLLIYAEGNVPVSIGALLFGSLLWVGACFFLYGKGTIMPVLYMPLAGTVSLLGYLFCAYEKNAVQKRRFNELLKSCVDPHIVDALLAQQEGKELPVGEKKQLAVMFVDIRGFSAMTRRLPAETVVQILNAFLSFVTDIILKNGGTLDKFIGDNAMAYWDQTPAEDAAYRACYAAMEMVRESEKLQLKIQSEFGELLYFGIGIDFGEAIVGNTGSLRRRDYTVIGDVVNTAAALESGAPGGKIYISPVVMRLLGEYSSCEPALHYDYPMRKRISVEAMELTALKEKKTGR